MQVKEGQKLYFQQIIIRETCVRYNLVQFGMRAQYEKEKSLIKIITYNNVFRYQRANFSTIRVILAICIGLINAKTNML